MPEWLASAASVRGKSHIDSQLPNQDSVVVQYCESADAWVAVVSDGAGTARRAEDGSRETTAAIAQCLMDFLRAADAGRVEIALFTKTLERGIEGVRAHLSASGSPLHDFHCTLVACLLTRHGGYVASIGDSVTLTSRFAFLPAGHQAGQATDLFPDANTVLHEPDRGEYANETYFLTQADWRAHLYIAPVPSQTDVVVLTTDGAMDVAMSRGRVFRGFLSNLVANLATTESRQQRDEIIGAWLGDSQTFHITGDDKTMVVLLRREAGAMVRPPIFLGSDDAPVVLSSKTATSPLVPSLLVPVVPTPRNEDQPRSLPSPSPDLDAGKARRLPIAAWITTAVAFYVAGAGTGAYVASNRQASREQPDTPPVVQSRASDARQAEPAPVAAALPASSSASIPAVASAGQSAESSASMASAAAAASAPAAASAASEAVKAKTRTSTAPTALVAPTKPEAPKALPQRDAAALAARPEVAGSSTKTQDARPKK